MRDQTTAPIRMLLDHSIITNDSRLYSVREDSPAHYPFGNKISGVKRKPPSKDAELEREFEAIYTVARLIREGKVSAFTSFELVMERMKDDFPGDPCRALADCPIGGVPSPLDWGKFFRFPTDDYVSKGEVREGKADRSTFSRVHFLSRLIELTPKEVDAMINQPESRGLTDFECESLRGIEWFKAMRARAQSDRHLPDLFHLWTALRNDIEVFLTTDLSLIRMVQGIEKEKSGFKVGVKVLSPTEFLKTQAITELDRFECDYNRFYWPGEIPGMF